MTAHDRIRLIDAAKTTPQGVVFCVTIGTMPQPLRFLSREIRGMHQAAYLIAAFSLLSQLLALGRDRLFAAVFGVSHTLDVYYAAFRVPDLIFATVASLFSIYAILPILSSLKKEEGETVLIPFLHRILLVFFIGMSFVSMIAYILAPVLASLVAPGIALHDHAYLDLVPLMRVLLLQPILLGASNTVAVLTQMRHRFLLYSVSPLLYNLGIIFGILVLYPQWGVEGLGWGVVLGAALHLGIQVPFFLSERSSKTLSLMQTVRAMRAVLLLSIPRTLAMSASQISLLAIVAFASLLAPGSIAVFTFAFNLQAVPLTIIGVSYSVAAFPTLSHLFANGKREEFVSYLEAALRHIIFWATPAAVFLVVMRAQIVRIILGAGRFDWGATRLTAAALALFALSLLAQSVTLLIARAYYAAGNTRKPLLYGALNVVVSISTSLIAVWLFKANYPFHAIVERLLRVEDVPGTSVLMLAMGFSIGAVVQAGIGYLQFARDFSVRTRLLGRLLWQSMTASIIGGAVSYAILAAWGAYVTMHTTLITFTEGSVAGVLGLTVTALTLWLLNNEELCEIITTIRRRFGSEAYAVAAEPTDVAQHQ